MSNSQTLVIYSAPTNLIELRRKFVATSELCHEAFTKLKEGELDIEVVFQLLWQHTHPSSSGGTVPIVAVPWCIENIELRGIVNLACAALYAKSVTGSFRYPELATLTEGLYKAFRINNEVNPELLAEEVLRFKALAPELYEELEKMKSADVRKAYSDYGVFTRNNT